MTSPTSQADIEIHAAASAEPVPLEIDDAPIPAVPVPAAPAAPWQDVDRAPCRQLPTAVPEHLGESAGFGDADSVTLWQANQNYGKSMKITKFDR